MTIYNLGWHHPRWTLSQISQQIFEQCKVKLSRPTISYTLAEWGYKFYKQTVAQALTEEHKKKGSNKATLYFRVDKRCIKAVDYMEIMKKQLIPNLVKKFKLIYQCDNASPHAAKITKAEFAT
ncbi:Winged_helix-turn helix domain [Hexamita inflata]|uniref:Winged helix-turn helix domain n=1 Tax=Hexamita inflata TaxID=28002 RepID=A0AA86NCX1_9EUKA|nr:Winged helix-turn helix domain [Hexamita inflata]